AASPCCTLPASWGCWTRSAARWRRRSFTTRARGSPRRAQPEPKQKRTVPWPGAATGRCVCFLQMCFLRREPRLPGHPGPEGLEALHHVVGAAGEVVVQLDVLPVELLVHR